jgi:hypothetical protein
MAHEGGAAAAGDDMRGSRVPWATIGAIESDGLRPVPPLDQAWRGDARSNYSSSGSTSPLSRSRGPLSMFASQWKSGDPDSTAPTRVLLTELP